MSWRDLLGVALSAYDNALQHVKLGHGRPVQEVAAVRGGRRTESAVVRGIIAPAADQLLFKGGALVLIAALRDEIAYIVVLC